MDHDCMSGLGIPGETPQAARPVEGMRKDGDWIGDAPRTRGEFACLREIYRVSPEVDALGEELFRKQVGAGYAATRQAMRSCERVRTMFDAEYVTTLDIRDEVIRMFLRNRGSEAAWRKAARKRMLATIYPRHSVSEFLDTVVRNARRLERYSFLYESR
jgi:hypothetical protein